jgi:catechol 2,3-dioxygenase-like lactoylglutathione lyase family enzyme
LSTCFCCEREHPEEALDRLRSRTEVAVCGGCLEWLLCQRTKDVVRAVPVLPVDDMADSVAFWTAAGFGVEVYDAGFAAAEHDGVELHLVDPASGRVRGEAYLHVRDVDAVHGSWRAAGLPVSELRDEPWGMREFHVVDPGRNRVRVGRST